MLHVDGGLTGVTDNTITAVHIGGHAGYKFSYEVSATNTEGKKNCSTTITIVDVCCLTPPLMLLLLSCVVSVVVVC